MFSRGYAQFKFLLQEKCCSATVGKLHYVAYIFLFYNMKSFVLEIVSFKEKKALKMKV